MLAHDQAQVPETIGGSGALMCERRGAEYCRGDPRAVFLFQRESSELLMASAAVCVSCEVKLDGKTRPVQN
jgi:hypothetical protein